MDNNHYLIQRRNREMQKDRMRLGISQMINVPLFNMFLIPIIVVSIVMWNGKNKLLSSFDIPQILYPVYKYLASIIAIIIPILLLLLIIESIGVFTARKPEADIQEAFIDQDLRNGCPILVAKKKIKHSEVIRYVFYSGIPLRTWVDKKDAIASTMSIHFVEEIKYYKSNGRMVVLNVANGVEPKKRDNLYDEEF